MTCDSPSKERCHSCAAQLKHRLYCDSCEKIQQLGKGDDYFTIFGHPRQFQLDAAAVEEAFEELILALHPDFYATAEPVEQILSVEHTTLLNEAKDALLNPYLRGRYLLTLLVPEIAATSVQPPQGFIIETFELQECLDQAEQGRAALEPLAKRVHDQCTATEAGLAVQFQQLEGYADQPELVEEIQSNLAKLKFLLNLQGRVSQIEKNL